MDLKLVLGACLDVDFEWFGAWRLLAGGRWLDLGDLETVGGEAGGHNEGVRVVLASVWRPPGGGQ